MRDFISDLREENESVGAAESGVASVIKRINADVPDGGFQVHDKLRVSDSGVSVVLCVLEYRGFVHEGHRYKTLSKTLHTRFAPIVLLELPFRTSRIWMRPETLSDKLWDFINPKDIDFPKHKRFSTRYFVVAEDPSTIDDLFPDSFWATVGNYRGLLLKAFKSHLLIAADKDLTASAMTTILTAGMDIASSLGPGWDGESFEPRGPEENANARQLFCYHCGDSVGRKQERCSHCGQPLDWN